MNVCPTLCVVVVMAMLSTTANVHEKPPEAKKKVVVPHKNVVWHRCVFTQYAKKFEGRRCADGSVFSHRRYVTAARGVQLGTHEIYRYGTNRVHGTVADRGTLPLHRASCPQRDVTEAVARKLGLYNPRFGRYGYYAEVTNGTGRRNVSNSGRVSKTHRNTRLPQGCIP